MILRVTTVTCLCSLCTSLSVMTCVTTRYDLFHHSGMTCYLLCMAIKRQYRSHKDSFSLSLSSSFSVPGQNLLLEFLLLLLFSSPATVLASGWCYLFVFAHNRFRWAAFTLACHDQTSNHELTGGLTGSECISACVCEREGLMCL